MARRRFDLRRRSTHASACAAWLAVAAFLTTFSGAASAGPFARQRGCETIRPQDRVVIVDARPAGCSTDAARLASDLQAREYAPVDGGGARRWSPVDWRSVAEENTPGVATIIYTHGNRIPRRSVAQRGLHVYHSLVRSARDDRPIRLILWSWPATQIESGLKDYRIKAARTRPVAYQLAWFVNQMPAGMPIGFLGYSYGARIESGAAHLLGGGSLGGLCLDVSPGAAERPSEHVYLAPAFDADWLAPRRFHGRTLAHVDRLLVTTNKLDPAMRFYALLSTSIHERALGYRGPKRLPRSYACRVQTRDVTAAVGRSHLLQDYTRAPGLMAAAWRRLTFAERAPEAIATEAEQGPPGLAVASR